MKAYNKRITIAKIGDILPLKSAILFVIALMSTLVLFVVPFVLQVILGIVAVTSFVMGIVLLILGKRILYLNSLIDHYQQNKAASFDVCQKY